MTEGKVSQEWNDEVAEVRDFLREYWVCRQMLYLRRYERKRWGKPEEPNGVEALLLAETGSRSRDGNFIWGYAFAIFYIFIVSFVKWLEIRKREMSIAWIPKVMFGIAGVVLFYQLYCGIYFFVCLLGGETYFMVG